METPLKISFQGGDSSDAVKQLISDNVVSLEHVYGRMTACHVTVQVPDRLSGPFAVHVHMSLPGGMDLNVEEETFDPDGHFLSWKPGSRPVVEPDGMAWRADPGMDLILNVHLRPSGKRHSAWLRR